MITLYINPNCAYCAKTVEVAKEVEAPLILKDIHDPVFAAELMELGGKRQMPFMVDDETSTMLYESDDIMKYLHKQFGS